MAFNLLGDIVANDGESWADSDVKPAMVIGWLAKQDGDVEININSGYPAVLNPADLCDRVQKAAGFAELDAPYMTAEDFAFYQRQIPGMFLFLGTGDGPALHTCNFDFDERILEKGASLFETLAVNFK